MELFFEDLGAAEDFLVFFEEITFGAPTMGGFDLAPAPKLKRVAGILGDKIVPDFLVSNFLVLH